MKRLRMVIVDDEPIACQALRRMLEEFPEIEVCGEADSVDRADALIREVRADVVLLDIELFGENGFDLVPRLDGKVAVVFVTAFSQYAIRAFEINALDYLLKPVTKERLSKTLLRMLERPGRSSPANSCDQLAMDDVILVKSGNRYRWLVLENVCAIEAEGDFTILRSTDGCTGTVWRRLHEWERILPPEHFTRIHRGLLVNLEQVESFETTAGGRLSLWLKGIMGHYDSSRRLTRSLRERLQARMSTMQL